MRGYLVGGNEVGDALDGDDDAGLFDVGDELFAGLF